MTMVVSEESAGDVEGEGRGLRRRDQSTDSNQPAAAAAGPISINIERRADRTSLHIALSTQSRNSCVWIYKQHTFLRSTDSSIHMGRMPITIALLGA